MSDDEIQDLDALEEIPVNVPVVVTLTNPPDDFLHVERHGFFHHAMPYVEDEAGWRRFIKVRRRPNIDLTTCIFAYQAMLKLGRTPEIDYLEEPDTHKTDLVLISASN